MILTKSVRSIEIPLMGIQRAIWSADSRYIATKSELMPHNIWIWSVQDVTLAAVLSKETSSVHAQAHIFA